MDRFVVEQAKSGAFFLKDLHHERYGMNSMALSIYFKTRDRADRICNMVNAEWHEFEQNPT